MLWKVDVIQRLAVPWKLDVVQRLAVLRKLDVTHRLTVMRTIGDVEGVASAQINFARLFLSLRSGLDSVIGVFDPFAEAGNICLFNGSSAPDAQTCRCVTVAVDVIRDAFSIQELLHGFDLFLGQIER